MTQLTRALQEQIVAAIRAGGFPHVAAQAFGVSRRRFHRWRKRGRSKTGDAIYRTFARAVNEAIAQARLRAEMDVFTEQARIWLQYGPGRETSRSPGWTVAIKPTAKKGGESNSLMDPLEIALLHEVEAALEGQVRERFSTLIGRASRST